MSVVRGTALSSYPSLVAELGGDPAALLRAAGVRERDVGNYDAFIPYRAAIRALESAAEATATADFGRRLAQRQGIEILGPVGVAARTAATVGDALAIFMGPDAYVSPKFYPSKQRDGKVVPTWNYTAVHAWGPIEFFEDPARILSIVTRLTDKHEGQRGDPWRVSDAPPDYLQSQLKGIVGLRVPIARIEGKLKLSQNRTPEDRAGAKAGLAASSDPMDRDVAALIPK